MSGPQMMGEVSKRGDRLLGLAQVAKAYGDGDDPVEHLFRTLDRIRQPHPLLNGPVNPRTMQPTRSAEPEEPKPQGKPRLRVVPGNPDAPPRVKVPKYLRRLRVVKRHRVVKVYRDKLVPPTKAVIREVKGGHKRWTNSRPQLVMQQEQADAYWRGHLKAGAKPRFPKSKNAAGYDPKNRRYYDPETVRFGAHLGDPNTYNDFQRVNQFGRGVSKGTKISKTFIPDAGKVTRNKGYVPAAIPATKLAAPARATRLADLRAGNKSKSAKRTRLREGKRPLYRRGTDSNLRAAEPNNMMMGHLNDTPTVGSKTHKKVRYGPEVSSEQQASIESSLPKKVKRPVTFHNSEHAIGGLPGRLGGVTFGRTGKKNPAHVLVPPKATPNTIRHEYEHSQPKRSFGRVANLQQDSLLRGREEGRADVGAIRHTGGKAVTQYEQHAELNRAARGGSKIAAAAYQKTGGDPEFTRGYDEVRTKMGMPHRGMRKMPAAWQAVVGAEEAGKTVASGIKRVRRLFGGKVEKVDTTMSEADAKRLAARYDTRGPLPKTLTREQRMQAYEARYIASGGKQGEKWKRRADLAETGRNIGLAGATAGAGITLAARTKRAAPYLRKVKITHHRADNAALASGTFGGASELYGEHARSRRASYQNSPAGVARSALSRMQAYTPEKKR